VKEDEMERKGFIGGSDARCDTETKCNPCFGIFGPRKRCQDSNQGNAAG